MTTFHYTKFLISLAFLISFVNTSYWVLDIYVYNEQQHCSGTIMQRVATITDFCYQGGQVKCNATTITFLSYAGGDCNGEASQVEYLPVGCESEDELYQHNGCEETATPLPNSLTLTAPCSGDVYQLTSYLTGCYEASPEGSNWWFTDCNSESGNVTSCSGIKCTDCSDEQVYDLGVCQGLYVATCK